MIDRQGEAVGRQAQARGTSAPSREMADGSQEHRELRKSSSMGSLYISTTICKPQVDSIINSVATILHSQMIEVSYIITLEARHRYAYLPMAAFWGILQLHSPSIG